MVIRMANKKLEESIVEAKEALDSVEQLGRMAYDLCDGILNNNKALVHDEKVFQKIQEKEKQVYDAYQKKIADARLKLKDIDPYYQWDEGLDYYMKLRHWKSMEMISFWDRLIKSEL